jgi:hypothetical protein
VLQNISAPFFVYDDAAVDPQFILVRGDSQYDFDTYEELEANPARCLDGIKAGATALAESLARTMRPGTIFAPVAAAPDAAIAPVSAKPADLTH